MTKKLDEMVQRLKSDPEYREAFNHNANILRIRYQARYNTDPEFRARHDALIAEGQARRARREASQKDKGSEV